MPLMRSAIGVLLAGGQGERLWPLTRDRAKPAVPFGGVYRIIDLTLSNCLNSDLRRVFVLTQYKALSLNRHVRRRVQMLLQHLLIVHLVDVVAGEDEDMLRFFGADGIDVLKDGVGRALIPGL